MRDRRAILTHILMVVAPLVMLAALTAAWFINSNTVGLSALSFASQNTGPGAALHFGTVVKGERVFDGGVVPNTLANRVLWGKEEKTEDSAIVIENMLPGQCEYYLLVGNDPITVSLTNLVYTGGDGEAIALPSTEKLPLAQCLGFYLIPVGQNELEGFDWDKVDDTVENGAPHSTPVIALARDAATGQLSRAVLKDLPASVALAPEGDGEASKAYILAIYCDPIYSQPQVGEENGERPVNALAGSVSFSLSFPKKDVAA